MKPVGFVLGGTYPLILGGNWIVQCTFVVIWYILTAVKVQDNWKSISIYLG